MAEIGGARWWARHGWVLVVALAMAILLVMASCQWPRPVRVSGHLVVQRVELRVAGEPLETAPDLDIPATLRLRQITWARTPAGLRIKAHSAELSEGYITLAALHADTGVVLTLARPHGGDLTLEMRGGNASVDVQATFVTQIAVDGAELAAPPGAGNPDDQSPRLFSAGIDGATQVPMQIDLGSPFAADAKGDGGWVMDPIAVSLLRFGRPVGSEAGTTHFASAILRGTLRLADTEDTETLDPGSPLAIDGFAGEVVRLEQARDGIELWFSGTARMVRLGPPGAEETLTPSILAFLYHQQSVNLLWLGAGFVLASVVKIRQWLAGKDTAKDVE